MITTMTHPPESLSHFLELSVDLEDIVFQDGIPIHISKSTVASDNIKYNSFIVYETNGDMVLDIT